MNAAITLGVLAAWITVVLVVSGLWRPGFAQAWWARLVASPSPDLAAPPPAEAGRPVSPGKR